jgi:hypothetical protein
MVDETHITRVYGADYVSLLSWLQKNVGKTNIAKPIIWWEGKNWYMKLVQGKMGDSYCEIHFENKKHLKLFEKEWFD